MNISRSDYEGMQKEIAFLREQLRHIRENPPDIPFHACDNSCCVARPEGMATNGGCRCDEHKLRAAVMYWRQLSVHYRQLFEVVRDGDRVKQWTEYRDHFAALAKARLEKTTQPVPSPNSCSYCGWPKGSVECQKVHAGTSR